MPKNTYKHEVEYFQSKNTPNYNKNNKITIKVIIDYNHDISSQDFNNITREYKNKYINNYDIN